MASESGLEGRCRIVAELEGCLLIKLWPLLRGLPDRFLLAPCGRVAIIEFKSRTGRLSRHQRLMRLRLETMGFKVYVCRSMTEFREIMRLTRM